MALGLAEIEKILRDYPGSRRIPVEQFLGSIDESMPEHFHADNLRKDASLYKWNRDTVSAIRSGIRRAYNG